MVKREFMTRARTKGFIIGTLLFPLILAFLFGGIYLTRILFQASGKTYYVIDQTGRMFAELTSSFTDTLSNGQPAYRFILKHAGGDLEDSLMVFQNEVMNKKIDGYLFIPADVIDSREVRYAARNVSDFEEQEDFRNVISRIVTNMRLERLGLSSRQIREEMAMGRVNLLSRQITDEGEIQKGGVPSFVLAYLLTYVLLLLMMIYGQTLMRSIIEEKSQRITETILSSIRPMDLMIGKLAGICGLGLTQLVVFGGMIYIFAVYGEPILQKLGVNMPDIVQFIKQVHFTPAIFIFMILFFLLGFVFFSLMFAAVGAMVNTEDEGQQFQMPLVFIIMIGYFIMFTVARNPETSMAFWASLIPFFTPLVMFARITVSDPIIPSGTYLSIFTMILSIVLLTMVVAKIYRVGILMYGKKPSLKETLKWIRYG